MTGEHDRPKNLEDRLSPRELDVLRLVADGQSNKEIALELHLSPNTVKERVSNIMLKLGASSRTRAAMAYWSAMSRPSSES